MMRAVDLLGVAMGAVIGTSIATAVHLPPLLRKIKSRG